MEPIKSLELADALIEGHEGRRNKLYQCTAGKWSIGIGRNLEDRGLRDDEIELMFANDLLEASDALLKYPWYEKLNAPRQAAMLDMMFQLGQTRFAKFRNMIEALAAGDYKLAASEALESKYAKQVPERAWRIASIIESGVMY